MLKIRIFLADLLYTHYLTKFLKYNQTDKGYKYFRKMKKYAERLNELEARLK